MTAKTFKEFINTAHFNQAAQLEIEGDALMRISFDGDSYIDLVTVQGELKIDLVIGGEEWVFPLHMLWSAMYRLYTQFYLPEVCGVREEYTPTEDVTVDTLVALISAIDDFVGSNGEVRTKCIELARARSAHTALVHAYLALQDRIFSA